MFISVLTPCKQNPCPIFYSILSPSGLVLKYLNKRSIMLFFINDNTTSLHLYNSQSNIAFILCLNLIKFFVYMLKEM